MQPTEYITDNYNYIQYRNKLATIKRDLERMNYSD